MIFLGLGLFLVTCTKDYQDKPQSVQEIHSLGVILLPSNEYAKIPVVTIPEFSTRALAVSASISSPPVVSQGVEGSCVAFGTTYAGRSIMWKKNHTASSYTQSVNIFSPEYLYNQIKISTSCTSGAYVVTGLNLLKSQGVCRWSAMPYTDVTCSTQPTTAQKTEAATYKIKDYATVPIDITSVKALIVNGIPVIVAGPVYTNFNNLVSGATLKAPSGTLLGNHCYCIVGYDDSKNAFKFQNSWGTAWSSSGFGWIDYSYIAQWWLEAYVILENTLATPTLTTTVASSIMSNSAVSGGKIVSNGGAAITVSGVCWSINTNPTVALSTKTTNGTLSGTFTSNITGLTANKLYYARAYATNSAGTGYGDQITFTTSSPTSTISDREGNVYKIVTVGTQVWMAENLKSTKYNDGTSIPNVTASTSWGALTTGAYCDYGNVASNSSTYGRLYNWYVGASSNAKNVCPTGWHVPSDVEWTTLTTYLGGVSVAGGKVKEAGTSHWLSPNTGATNTTGFTALPSGTRDYLGTFGTLKTYGCWWTATQASASTIGWYRIVSYNNASVTRSDGIGKKAGLSIRCVKNN